MKITNKLFQPTVGSLIEELNKYAKDMPVAIDGNLGDEILISERLWVDGNYPYDRPDVNFINLM